MSAFFPKLCDLTMHGAYLRTVQAAGPRARVHARRTAESSGYVPELYSNTIYIIYNIPGAPKFGTCTLEYHM